MNKINTFVVIVVTLCMVFIIPQHTLVHGARVDKYGLGYGQNAGLGTRDVRDTTVSIIHTALGILGVLMLLLILWSIVGAAAGGDGAGEKARHTITAAVIGLIVIFVAYALTSWIFNVLERTT